MRGRCSLCVCVFHFLPQESLNGDMKEMIKFTYELKCFKDALDIKVFITVFKYYAGIKFTLIIDISFKAVLQEFYPDKKPLEAKAKKDYGESEFLG